ncbi:hypothetical protein ACIA5G_50985 [Amycolatopsis sp. NPDC051758]|uniref:hypothetical protein n=1 Tax=Amycolatopsis sp. NPDC051758 TaxID=3363935 RepID=UPI00379CDA67
MFLVEADHIDALLTAGLAYGRELGTLTWYHPIPDGAALDDLSALAWRLTSDTAGRVGAMLLAENARSVNHAHQRDDWEPPYLFRELAGDPDPVVVLKAISCLENQSCEHPGWPDSEASAFCDALHRMAVCMLPGWRQLTDATWPIRDRRIFEQPNRA